ncbi:hypothetical protein Droror1_Dr00006382 [Drosera rotundifolia]
MSRVAWKKFKRGKKARKELKCNHTSGSQSFVARADMFIKRENRVQFFVERFKDTHVRNRHEDGEKVWINDKAKEHHDEIVAKIAKQSQLNITNPRSEEEISIDVLEKRSGYLKGYGIRKNTYVTKSQAASNSEVASLKQVVTDQAKVVSDQAKMITDYSKKFENMVFFIATKCGVDPTIIPGLIPSSEMEEDTWLQNVTLTIYI